mmetsp:Transcript_28474/g.91775  ORF Transcript_28474/g.91775 Transcript_28474/m.91775 type:complete len:428 (+) Transcript_28474:3-1286(+)
MMADFTSPTPLSARVHRLASMDRDDDVKRPGRPASSYMSVSAESEAVEFETLLQESDGWLVYSVERAWTDEDAALVLLEVADAGLQRKIYFEEAFLDRGIRIHAPLGCRVAVVGFPVVEAWLAGHDVGPKVSFVGNTGRCGSTLFHRLLLWTGEVVSLSEPQWSDQLGKSDASRNATDAQLQRAVRTTALADFLLASKRFPPKAAAAWSLNPKGGSGRFQRAFAAAFPESKHLFLYRSCRKVTESFGSLGRHRATEAPTADNVHLRLEDAVVPGLREAFMKLSTVGVVRNVEAWCATVLEYLEEGSIDDTRKFVLRMDEFVGADTKHVVVPKALAFLDLGTTVDYDPADVDRNVFGVDSQKGSNMSRMTPTKAQQQQKKKEPFLTDTDLALIKDDILVKVFDRDHLKPKARLDGHDLILKGSAGIPF